MVQIKRAIALVLPQITSGALCMQDGRGSLGGGGGGDGGGDGGGGGVDDGGGGGGGGVDSGRMPKRELGLGLG